MKLLSILLALCLFSNASGEEKHIARIHEGFLITVPKTNYVILSEQSFHPENHVLIDLSRKTVSIFSPYKSDKKLFERELTPAESEQVVGIFLNPYFRKLPMEGGEHGFDSWQLTIRANIVNQKRMMKWGQTENLRIKQISNLYKNLNQLPAGQAD